MGHLIYKKNFDWLLNGFCFEDSAFDANTFNIYVFVQPLYVPKNHLWFNFGHRLNFLSKKGYDKWWTISNTNEANIIEEISELLLGPGLRFINKTTTQEKLLKTFFNLEKETPHDFNSLEALVYSRIICNDFLTAQHTLEKLLRTIEIESLNNPNLSWLSETKKRLASMEKLLAAKDFSMAKDQLYVWREYTLKELGLL